MTITDIGSIRSVGWQRVECDTEGCEAAEDIAPGEGYPDDWTREYESRAVMSSSARDYCPEHSASDGLRS